VVHDTTCAVKLWADVLYYTFEYLHNYTDADDLAEVLLRYPGTIKKKEDLVPGAQFRETYEIYYGLSAKGIYQTCMAVLSICGIGSDEFDVKRVSTRG
jgi:hypothetical protein